MNPQPSFVNDQGLFDLKSLGFCLLTIILNAGPQLPLMVQSITSMLTGLAAVSTVAYNLFKVFNDFRNTKK
jgi:hypothetical protein